LCQYEHELCQKDKFQNQVTDLCQYEHELFEHDGLQYQVTYLWKYEHEFVEHDGLQNPVHDLSLYGPLLRQQKSLKSSLWFVSIWKRIIERDGLKNLVKSHNVFIIYSTIFQI